MAPRKPASKKKAAPAKKPAAKKKAPVKKKAAPKKKAPAPTKKKPAKKAPAKKKGKRPARRTLPPVPKGFTLDVLPRRNIDRKLVERVEAAADIIADTLSQWGEERVRYKIERTREGSNWSLHVRFIGVEMSYATLSLALYDMQANHELDRLVGRLAARLLSEVELPKGLVERYSIGKVAPFDAMISRAARRTDPTIPGKGQLGHNYTASTVRELALFVSDELHEDLA